MIALWMLTTILFTALLAVAAVCSESAFRGAGRQARWPWLTALAVAVVWPLLAPLARRVIAETSALSNAITTLPTIQVLPDGVSATTLGSGAAVNTSLIIVWMLASLIVAARMILGLERVKRVRASAKRRTIDGVPVLLTDDLGPAIVGIVEPAVLLPRAVLALDESLRRIVLRHEEEHRRARDPWIVLGAAIAVAIMPWNLPLWFIARRARLALELDCDARVIAAGTSPKQYAQLLLLISQRPAVAILAPMLVASTSHLERRIIAMTARRNSRTRIALAMAGAFAAVAIACTSNVGDQVVDPKSTKATPVVASSEAPTEIKGAYFEFQVEKAVRQIPGTGHIRYPDMLRSANVEGEVLAQFVVDEKGKFEPNTFKALKSDHDLFTQAVRVALPAISFTPAEVGGRAVRQLVQQPFTFSLSRNDAPRTGASLKSLPHQFEGTITRTTDSNGKSKWNPAVIRRIR